MIDLFRNATRREMPIATRIVVGALAVTAVLPVVVFVLSVVTAASYPTVAVAGIVVAAIAFVVEVAVPVVVLILVLRSWVGAPVVVTVLALWGITPVQFQSPLYWMFVIASLGMGVAVWLPSARRFARDQRATRLAGSSRTAEDVSIP